MKRIVIALCLLCVNALPRTRAEDAPLAEKSLVIPGTYSEQTTVEDFKARFGAANLRVEDDQDYDGGSMLVLFPDDPTRRAYVSFHDSEKMTGVASIAIRDRVSLWRGKLGVHVGMTMTELRAVNGKPFYFSGVDSLGRAWVHDQWSPALSDSDATLGTLDVAEGEQMYFGVELGPRVPFSEIAADAYPHDEVWALSDDYARMGELFEVTEIEATTSLDDE